jgi:hypothetical protein
MVYLEQIRLLKDLDAYLKVYLKPIFGTTSEVIIDYITTYNKFGIDLKIRNLDTTNTMQYSLNTQGNNITIPASGTDIISNTPLEMVFITPNNSTGNFSVEHFGINFEDLVK